MKGLSNQLARAGYEFLLRGIGCWRHRIVAAAAMGIMVIAGISGWRLAYPDMRKSAEVMLLYAGADDCAPCRVWQRGEGAAFQTSAEFSKITYREVKSQNLLDLLKDEYWPEDLRDYRDQLGRGAGAPLWFLVVDRSVVARGSGAGQWEAAILPRLKSLVR